MQTLALVFTTRNQKWCGRWESATSRKPFEETLQVLGLARCEWLHGLRPDSLHRTDPTSVEKCDESMMEGKKRQRSNLVSTV